MNWGAQVSRGPLILAPGILSFVRGFTCLGMVTVTSTFKITYEDKRGLCMHHIFSFSSVCELQRMLTTCDYELSWLDMSINSKKLCCMRIGLRCNF